MSKIIDPINQHKVVVYNDARTGDDAHNGKHTDLPTEHPMTKDRAHESKRYGCENQEGLPIGLKRNRH